MGYAFNSVTKVEIDSSDDRQCGIYFYPQACPFTLFDKKCTVGKMTLQ